MKTSSVFLTLAVVFMIATITCGIVGTQQAHQYQWRMRFAQSHLSVAQAVTDADSQYTEINKAIEIYDAFPKQGNYDLLNKRNPNTDLQTTWTALYQLRDYTDQIRKLDKSGSSYQLGIYNSQEKIKYFQQTFGNAFQEYVDYGLRGWLQRLSVILFCCWFMLSFMGLATHVGRESRLVALYLITAIPMVIAAIIFLIITTMPILYIGPT